MQMEGEDVWTPDDDLFNNYIKMIHLCAENNRKKQSLRLLTIRSQKLLKKYLSEFKPLYLKNDVKNMCDDICYLELCIKDENLKIKNSNLVEQWKNYIEMCDKYILNIKDNIHGIKNMDIISSKHVKLRDKNNCSTIETIATIAININLSNIIIDIDNFMLTCLLDELKPFDTEDEYCFHKRDDSDSDSDDSFNDEYQNIWDYDFVNKN